MKLLQRLILSSIALLFTASAHAEISKSDCPNRSFTCIDFSYSDITQQESAGKGVVITVIPNPGANNAQVNFAIVFDKEANEPMNISHRFDQINTSDAYRYFSNLLYKKAVVYGDKAAFAPSMKIDKNLREAATFTLVLRKTWGKKSQQLQPHSFQSTINLPIDAEHSRNTVSFMVDVNPAAGEPRFVTARTSLLRTLDQATSDSGNFSVEATFPLNNRDSFFRYLRISPQGKPQRERLPVRHGNKNGRYFYDQVANIAGYAVAGCNDAESNRSIDSMLASLSPTKAFDISIVSRTNRIDAGDSCAYANAWSVE